MNFIVLEGKKIIKDRREPVKWYITFECYLRNSMLALVLATALVSFGLDNDANAAALLPPSEPQHVEQPMIPNYKVDKYTKIKKEEIF